MEEWKAEKAHVYSCYYSIQGHGQTF